MFFERLIAWKLLICGANEHPIGEQHTSLVGPCLHISAGADNGWQALCLAASATSPSPSSYRTVTLDLSFRSQAYPCWAAGKGSAGALGAFR